MNDSDMSPINDDQLTVEQLNITLANLYLFWIETCKESNFPYLDKSFVQFWISGVLLNVVGLFGVLGNLISMIILSRPEMRSSYNFLIYGLASIDTISIISCLLVFGIRSMYPYLGDLFWYVNYVFSFTTPIMYPIALITQTTSIYMITIVTLERYLAVCHPLRACALCTYGRVKIYLTVCVCFALIFNMPRFWEFVTVTYQVPNTTIGVHCVKASPLRNNHTYIHVYKHWIYLIVNALIPFLPLVIFNSLIFRQVKRVNRKRRTMTRSETSEIGLAIMLMCAVVIFLLARSLNLAVNIMNLFKRKVDPFLIQVATFVSLIQISVNFLIYISFGKKFRQIFILMFFKRCVKSRQDNLKRLTEQQRSSQKS